MLIVHVHPKASLHCLGTTSPHQTTLKSSCNISTIPTSPYFSSSPTYVPNHNCHQPCQFNLWIHFSISPFSISPCKYSSSHPMLLHIRMYLRFVQLALSTRYQSYYFHSFVPSPHTAFVYSEFTYSWHPISTFQRVSFLLLTFSPLPTKAQNFQRLPSQLLVPHSTSSYLFWTNSLTFPNW